MEPSIILAKVIGLFGMLSTSLIIIRYKKHLEMEEKLAQNPGAIYASGFVFLMFGILILVMHHVWSSDWKIIITIIGWLTLLKGAMRVLYPKSIKNFAEKKMNDGRFILAEIGTFIISAYLVYIGFVKY